jgi:hypothetical protein
VAEASKGEVDGVNRQSASRSVGVAAAKVAIPRSKCNARSRRQDA